MIVQQIPIQTKTQFFLIKKIYILFVISIKYVSHKTIHLSQYPFNFHPKKKENSPSPIIEVLKISKCVSFGGACSVGEIYIYFHLYRKPFVGLYRSL